MEKKSNCFQSTFLEMPYDLGERSSSCWRHRFCQRFLSDGMVSRFLCFHPFFCLGSLAQAFGSYLRKQDPFRFSW